MGGFPNTRRVSIIAPVVIAANSIRLDIEDAGESRFQILLIILIEIEILKPELASFFERARHLDNAATPLFYYCNVLLEQTPEKVAANRIQVRHQRQVLNQGNILRQ